MVISNGSLGEITTKYFDEYVPRDPFDNVRYRIELLEEASADKETAFQLRKMCSEDPLFYINSFCYSYSPKESIYGDPRTPFNLYDLQCETVLDLLDGISNGMDVAMPKSRGIGASWMCISAIEWCWHFRDFLSFLMVSRKESLVDGSNKSDSLFWKLDFIHRHEPRWLLPSSRWLGHKDPGRKLLCLHNNDNDSAIHGESTTGNIGVGGRHTAIFFDEFALQQDGYAALTGSRDVTNCRIGCSTPRGKNHYYEFCEKIAPKVLRLHWSRHDIFKRGIYTMDSSGKVELLDDFRGMVRYREMGEKEIVEVMYPDDYKFLSCDKFKLRSPWFDYECTRCSDDREIMQELEIDWLGSEFQFFNVEMIEKLRMKHCIDPLLVGDLEFDPVTLEPKRFVEDPNGNLQLWIQPDLSGEISSDRRFVIGSDVSAGTGASNSCSSVVDRNTGEKVGLLKNSHILPRAFGQQTVALARWFNEALMIWDRSGPTGEVFSKAVMDNGYGRIYFRRNEKKIGRPMTDEPGVFLNNNTKGVILQDYRDALNFVRFINRSASGMNECLEFIKKEDGSIEHSASMNAVNPDAARTAHGDEVIADALACMGMIENQLNNEPQKEDIPYGSLAWRMNFRKEAEVSRHVTGLGSHWN